MKKIIKKLKKIYRQKKFNIQKKLTLKKIKKITGLDIPKEYRKYLRKHFSMVTLSPTELKENCILFAVNRAYLTKEETKKINDLNVFVVSKKPLKDIKYNIVSSKTKECAIEILKYIRNLTNIKVITVTGSVGKTSTKEMIESVLKEKYENKLLCSKGNSNSYKKIAVNVNNITFGKKIYLQEVGASSDKNIIPITSSFLESNIVVYTNILDNHIETYGSRENILKEKSTLSLNGKENGLTIINYDDELLRNYDFKQSTVSYSLNNKNADYYAQDINVSDSGTSFTVVDNKKNKKVKISIKVIGEHHVLNVLVAYIIGNYLGISNKLIISGVKKFKTKGIRQNLIDFGKYKVLADCYNSSYDAVKNIMKTFEYIKTSEVGSKIAVIGDIFELGEFSSEIHTQLGKLLANYNVDKIIFQGTNVRLSYNEYKKYKDNSVYCSSRKELIDTLNKTIKTNDIILFKASHGMNFASIIDNVFGAEVGEISSSGHKEYKLIKDKNFEYTIFENNITINKYFDNDEIIKIPNELKKKPIEKLGKSLFEDNKNITKVVLSKNIKRLRAKCFSNSSIKNIEFNSGLKAIGIRCFEGCSNLESIKLPNELLEIEYMAFANCKKLSKIVIPNFTMKISQFAFKNSNNIVIYCEKDSYAHKYAIKNNIKYEIIKK